MNARTWTLAVILAAILAVPGASAQDVYINGQAVTLEEIRELQQKLGIPETAPIPAGRYWYDPVSGLWGMEGSPMMGQILPGLELGGELQANASGGGTGVFINGRELHPQEVAYLQQIFGYVLPGRFWMDWRGIGGYEGGPPLFDVRAAAASSGAGGMYAGSTRRTPFGGLGSDGNCSYYMHPNGSSVMTC